MRLQGAHLTHRLSLPGNLAEHPSKIFRQSLPIGDLNPQSVEQRSKTTRRETWLIGSMHPGRQIQQLQIVQRRQWQHALVTASTLALARFGTRLVL